MEGPTPITIAGFLAWEARQKEKHELIDGVIVAMSTPTRAHGRLVRRLNRAIDAAVGDRCDVYVGDMTVSIPWLQPGSAPRPDIVVTSDERDRRPHDERDLTISWPKLIVEVLSPSTADADRGKKMRNYFSIPTVEEYLLVDSLSRSVTLHSRIDGHVITSWPDPFFGLTSIRCDIALQRLYDEISLPQRTNKRLRSGRRDAASGTDLGKAAVRRSPRSNCPCESFVTAGASLDLASEPVT